MEKMKKHLALGLVLALACLLFAGCGGSDELKVDLINSLGYDLNELYISESDSTDWGESILYTTFADGERIKLVVEPSSYEHYDMMVIDADGDYFYFYELPLTPGATVELMTTDGWYEAVVTPKRGEPTTIQADFEVGDSGEVSAPTPYDPLDATFAMPGYESLLIPYPSTMQVIQSNEHFFQLDAVNDPDNHNVILFDLVGLEGTYEQRLNAADTAQSALLEIAQKICDIQFPNMMIQNIGADFYDGGSYLSAMYYVWMSGEVFQEAADVPVRGVVEVRYYGPTGYVLTAFSLADQGVIRNYFEIAQNILNNTSFNEGWTTPKQGSAQWSDPGDQVPWDDGYDPWSDPGDNGYDWYNEDDAWYEPNDYDPWSDPGDYGYDYEDEYYEPNDNDF